MRPRSTPSSPSPRRVTDRRYRSARWRRLRDAVLGVVGGKPTALCFWPDSPPHLAQVAHHTRPVYPGMPDLEFYDRGRIVPSCQHHNKAEGFLRAGGTPVDEPPRRSIFSRRSKQ